MSFSHNLSPQGDPPIWGNPEGIDPQLYSARRKALSRGCDTFKFACGTCDRETPHDLKWGVCLFCFPALSPTASDPFRVHARRLSHKTYEGVCPECGPSPCHTRNGKCATCYTTNGTRRQERPNPIARREARVRGDATYLHGCALHGVVPHHTRRGLCLSCFDTQGHPRDEVYIRFCKDCGGMTMHERITRACTCCDPQAARNVTK